MFCLWDDGVYLGVKATTGGWLTVPRVACGGARAVGATTTRRSGARHTVIRGMALHEDSRGLVIPVDSGEASRNRNLAATVNYLAMDRPDVQFWRPTLQSMAAFKRAVRYLLKHPSMQFEHLRVPIDEARCLRVLGMPHDAP